MKAFQEAVEAWDFERLGSLLHDDVVFTSPVAFRPYTGKPIVHAILRGVGRVFEDFRYEKAIEDGHESALFFAARVGDVQLQGVDVITTDDDGLVTALTVMVRPLRAAQALAEAMGAQLDRIQAEAGA